MKRPSDQAKLFFLGLLRTASALATEPSRGGGLAAVWPTLVNHHHHHHQWRGSPVSAVATLSPPPQAQQQYKTAPSTNHNLTLRLAQRADVPSIQRCNLATLPENYNTAFYVQHLATWPDLALVVVEENNNDSRPRMNFSPFPQSKPTPNVVAYVLGKVDTPHPEPNLWMMNRQPRSVGVGHVTSLAVLPDYRRQGLAACLMEQLHSQLAMINCNQVGLHVRQSNVAATALYHRFGYAVAQRIAGYYQDGEDALYMVKQLHAQIPGDLPRTVGATSQEEEEEELLTGTL